MPTPRILGRALLLIVSLICLHGDMSSASDNDFQRYLYVACPGVRNYLEYGGHGLLVFAIDDGHRFVRRIQLQGFDAQGKPLNVKGICGHAATHRLFITTLNTIQCVDLLTDQLVWERPYEAGCDRAAISPDGTHLYVPSLEQDHWKVIRAVDGEELTRLVTHSKSHNTVYGPSGQAVYLAGLGSRELWVADATTHTIAKKIGPFSHSIRPFTINRAETLCYVNVNELLGFEIGDLVSGRSLARVSVPGYSLGPVKRHGCPSHGIGLTPDEREIWLTDGHHRQLHVFDVTSTPPKLVSHVNLRDEPGWIRFSRDGQLAYPSTGEVIEVASRRIIQQLTDESGQFVQSEKSLEVHVRDNRPIWVGDQFGLGMAP